jgi:hypothetical protein
MYLGSSFVKHGLVRAQVQIKGAVPGLSLQEYLCQRI